MYKAINNSDNSSLFTEYEGQNHGIWEMAIREPGLWEWVFSQKNQLILLFIALIV